MIPSQLVPSAKSPVAIHAVRRCCRSAGVIPEKESGARAVLALAHGVGKIPSSFFHSRGARRSVGTEYRYGGTALATRFGG